LCVGRLVEFSGLVGFGADAVAESAEIRRMRIVGIDVSEHKVDAAIVSAPVHMSFEERRGPQP